MCSRIEHMFDDDTVDVEILPRPPGCHRAWSGPEEVPESRLGELDALESELAELAGVLNATHGRVVALVARALQRELWAQPGIHSPGQWLAWQLGLSRASARRLVGLAGRAEELPVTLDALSTGEISVDQAAVVGRHVPADHEASASGLARVATVRQLERSLSRYSFEPLGTEPGDPIDDSPERREVSFGATESGRWHLRADLPVDEGARFEAALSGSRAALVDAAQGDDERRRISWADALLALGETAMSSPLTADPSAGRVTVLAHLEADPVDSTRPGVLSLHLGSPLPTSIARMILCDCDLVPVWERHGTPVSVGRTTRVVPRRLRRLIEHRDGGCRVPGCERHRRLQIHHIWHWEDGGPTDSQNLVALCPFHHRLHHLGSLGITGDADDPSGLTFTDPRGRVLAPAGRPRAPDAIPSEQPYAHPSGEPFDPHWLTLGASPN
jgi:Domain of unknown function (DUF222)/HNH endonuclease